MNPVQRLALAALFVPLAALAAPYQMESLNRGVVAVRTGTNSVYVGWRHLGLDAAGTGYNVYRGSSKVNSSPVTNSTNLVDTGANLGTSNTYTVRPVVNGVEQSPSEGYTLGANAPVQQYLRVPLQVPSGGTTPDGVAYTYSPNDCSAGDLDGDGDYELIVKWDPSNAKDNSQSGYTGNVYLDAYTLAGTRLWRIDLGRNIRAGAHYTQFQVYDFDGDGRAELMCKTADGTISGTGQVIGSASADHRNSSGYVLSGPEFLTVFDGQTGAALATTNYLPARGTVSSWGDSYGNRVDRFLAGVAYLDGTRPSAIFSRGYYTRTVVVAWDWRNGQLSHRWTFDSNSSGSTYEGRGNHQLSVADVDDDGRQEIVFGSLGINDNGAPMWATNHHGDALHVGDFIPGRAGLEVFKPSEWTSELADYMLDARTGAIIWSHPVCGCDNGRGVAGDVWAGSPGAEAWSSAVSGLSSTSGSNVGRKPGSTNFLVWWDADPVRELLDSNRISKYGTSSDTLLLTATDCASNNGTKATPALSADLFGDWREEVVWRETGNNALRIYTTTHVTSARLHTLMHDPQYRVAIAWQNTAYNQPPHPSFFLGDGMATPPAPAITYVGGGTPPPPPPPGEPYQTENAALSGGAFVETTNSGYTGSGYVNFPASGGTCTFSGIDGEGGGAKILHLRYANGSTASRAGQLTVNGVTSSVTFPSTGSWTTWNTLTVSVNLASGANNTVVFQSTGQDLANLDQFTVEAGASADTYQSENASVGGGAFNESTNSGYNGTGYVNFPTNGGTLTFGGVDGNGGGTKALAVRYANGSGASRTGQLVVNGTATAITFPATSGWTTWASLTVNVTLANNGSNTIELRSTGQDLANIDQIVVP